MAHNVGHCFCLITNVDKCFRKQLYFIQKLLSLYKLFKMAHRINERNIGDYSINSTLKVRRIKKANTLTIDEKNLAKQILLKVYDAMEFDKEMSNVGHLSPDAKFTDGGRITLMMNRINFETLFEIINKL